MSSTSASMGDFMTTTEKGAPALTAEGAIIAQLMQGERGGALTTLSAQLVGPRKPGTSTTLVAGLSRDALIAAMDMVLGEGGGLGAAATQHNVADLVVLTFEAADILEGRGERTLFVWMFLRLLPLLPAGLVSQLLRQVPHYASWRTLAMLYETATADIPKTADAAHASLLQDVRRAIVHMWAAQLLRDEASMKKAAAGGAAAPASAGAGGACADAAKPAGKPKLSLASKWAPRMGGHFDRTCGLAAHLVEEVARQRALLAASAPRGEEAAAPAVDDDAMDMDMDMDMDVDLPSAAATAPAALVAADVAPGMPAATFADGPVAAPKFDTLSPIARAKQRAYRIMLSALHAQLDVVEVKMAGKRWREIEPTSVPSRANKVYRAAFMNQMPKTKHARMNKEASKAGHRAGVLLTPGATLRSESVDRVECAEHFTAAAMASIANPEAAKVIKGGRNQAHELVTAYMGYKEEAADIMVEAMWANLVHGIESKGKFMPGLPLSDVSGSMAGIPMQVSIALGILMAKMQPKTSPWYGKLISFESNPQWCDIAACETLAASVNVVKSMPWGGSTNFGAALQLILQRAIAERVAQEDMPKILYVFTDMQFDQAQEGMGGSYGIRDATQMSDASEEPVPAHFRVAGTDIRAAFRDAGYTPPMIVFWNLRADGPPTFQAETSQPGVAMMSGFSQECLKQFFDEGELHSEEASGGAPAKVEKTPWQVLFEKLNSERYDRLRRVLMRVNAGLFTGYRWAKPAFRVEAEARAAAAAAAAAAEKEEAAVAAGAGASA